MYDQANGLLKFIIAEPSFILFIKISIRQQVDNFFAIRYTHLSITHFKRFGSDPFASKQETTLPEQTPAAK